MGRLTELLRPRTPSVIGVDVSARRVKLLELEKTGSGYRIVAYAGESLPDDTAASDFGIENVEPIAQAIRNAFERSGSRTRDAAIAVSGPAVITKTILMPSALDDLELEQQIHMDIEHYVSRSLSDVFVDFQVLEADPKDPTYNRVLLVACRREKVEVRLAALEMAGLTPRIVDVEEYALQNACTLLAASSATDSPTDSVAVFDVGELDTRLTIQQGQRSRYTRSIAFGGRRIAHELVSRFALADIEQMHTRLRLGELTSSDIADELIGFVQELASHIGRALDFYLSAAADSQERIARIVVTGGVARLPGISELLAERLEWSSSLGNPLAGMPASPAAKRNRVDEDAPALMVAAGLALRGVIPA